MVGRLRLIRHGVIASSFVKPQAEPILACAACFDDNLRAGTRTTPEVLTYNSSQ
ncbi:hypothetical protein ADILRU_1489 [Leifsonia rubra CMS 76R]|nr:hypothetical protein ADILRU_1489 [Leifsonia rubra CMS 76R]